MKISSYILFFIILSPMLKAENDALNAVLYGLELPHLSEPFLTSNKENNNFNREKMQEEGLDFLHRMALLLRFD